MYIVLHDDTALLRETRNAIRFNFPTENDVEITNESEFKLNDTMREILELITGALDQKKTRKASLKQKAIVIHPDVIAKLTNNPKISEIRPKKRLIFKASFTLFP